MKFDSNFSEILQASRKSWISRKVDECVLSLALPIKTIDPLKHFPVIADQQQFSFLWDLAPDVCIAASGKCQSFELIGQRRFELSQRFVHETFARLIDVVPEAPMQSKPKILFAFTFFEQNSEINRDLDFAPAVQAILPSWQLSAQAGNTWLRLNAVVSQESNVREFAEKIWLMREKLSNFLCSDVSFSEESSLSIKSSQDWESKYRLSLAQGIDLVNSGQLEKLVLAVRQSIVLNKPLNPLAILASLRNHQKYSCRFLWQRSKEESFFGASPERLLSLRQNNMITDALAGTTISGPQDSALLSSEKNLREHQVVISSIYDQLSGLGLSPQSSLQPLLARHGKLVHLHTPISSHLSSQSPLQILNALHPTPAVAGLPRENALKWLRTIEQFDRGLYASPIGWMDTMDNAEFRVGIRCGYARSRNLDLIAGAGIVKGSTVDDELQEVRLKFAVLKDQIFSDSKFSGQTF